MTSILSKACFLPSSGFLSENASGFSLEACSPSFNRDLTAESPTAPLLGLMLDLVILLLPEQELLSAAAGGHVLNAHMNALPQDSVANLHAMLTPQASLQALLTLAACVSYRPGHCPQNAGVALASAVVDM